VPLESLTRDLLPETRATFLEIKSVVTSTIPEATEKVNLGWKSLNFSHPNVGYFCGLFPVDDRVIMVFEFGVLLPDPDGILNGQDCAKQVRFARIRAHEAIPRAALKRLLRGAVSLPSDRTTRLALVRAGARPVLRKPRPRKRVPSHKQPPTNGGKGPP
jgi:hypothetical protein